MALLLDALHIELARGEPSIPWTCGRCHLRG